MSTLNFGKHKGKTLKEVPLNYLAWLLVKYTGTSIPRSEIEAEAISRGCEQRNGKWGIMRSSGAASSIVNALFPVRSELDDSFDWESADHGDEPWIYHGIPNMD